MRLLLVPHAPTVWNAEERFQGWTDMPLSESGKRQAALVARRLQQEQIHECTASNLRRAWETAKAITTPRLLPHTADPRLRELNFGTWEGKTYPDIRAEDATAALAWEADPMQVSPPGGETLAELAERLTSFLATLRNTQQVTARTMLVVAHRGSLRVLLCLALGLSPRAWWQFRLEPASISELEIHDQVAVLNCLNDTHHLREAAHAG